MTQGASSVQANEVVQRSGITSEIVWKPSHSVRYVDAVTPCFQGFLSEDRFLFIRVLLVQVQKGALTKTRRGMDPGEAFVALGPAARTLRRPWADRHQRGQIADDDGDIHWREPKEHGCGPRSRGLGFVSQRQPAASRLRSQRPHCTRLTRPIRSNRKRPSRARRPLVMGHVILIRLWVILQKQSPIIGRKLDGPYTGG